MSGYLGIATSGLNAFSKEIAQRTHNLSNAKTVAAKRGEIYYFTQVTNNSNSTTACSGGGVTSITRSTIDQQGIIENTGISTDIAVNGSGMFVVNTKDDTTGTYYYTRSGSFRQDNKGNFVNPSGVFLYGWQLDNEGRLPGESGNINTTSAALLGSLSVVNLRAVSGAASATTTVTVGIDLDASVSVIKGAGEVVATPKSSSSLNSDINFTDLIIPSDVVNGGRIQLGDKLSIKATPPGEFKDFVYGGLASSFDITNNIFGATTPTQIFTAATDGNSFTATVNGSEYTFVFKSSGTPNTLKGEFNSLSTLSQAMNLVPNLKSRVGSNKLYVSSANGTDAITFKDINGSFVSALGIQNVESNPYHFTTLSNLMNALNISEGITASQNIVGIDMHASLPTGTLDVVGYTDQQRTATSANSSTTLTNQNKRNIIVDSVAHGLSVGDYVNINGFVGQNGASLSSGLYMVTNASANTFTIASETNLTATGQLVNASTEFTWQRVPGRNYQTTQVQNPQASVNAGSYEVTIDMGASTGLASGDRIFLKGFSSTGSTNPGGAIIPDGYYTVNSTTATGFTITPPPSLTLTTTALSNLSVPISFQKIEDKLAPTSIYTTSGSSIVKVYIPNNNYKIGDVFTYQNIVNDTININNITFNGSTVNIITAVSSDANGDYIEYSAPTSANTTGFVSNTNINNISFNGFGRMFKELGLSTTQFSFGPAYNSQGGSSGTNLSEGFANAGDSVYSRSLTIYDSLGIEHDFRISFGKLDNNIWAAEIHSSPNSDGTYDIISPRTDGQVASGTLIFNGDGSLGSVSTSLGSPVQIQWKDGAMASNITFNWGTAGVPQGTVGATVYGLTDGMRQVNTRYNVRFLDQNGVQPGLLNSVSIDTEGYVIAGFSNGSSKRVFKIPIAQFGDVNGLAESTGNIYLETNISGGYNLKEPGTGGAGTITSEALEQSNINQTDELTKIVEANNNYQAVAKAMSAINKMNDTLDRNMNI